MKINNRIYKTCVLAFYVFVVLFIIKYIRDINFKAIFGTSITFKILPIAFSVRMLGLLISPLSWELLLNVYHGKQLNRKKIYRIYAESWMGRYMPGKLGWVGGKVLFAINEGVRADTALVTSFLDSILQVFSSLFVSAIIFLFTKNVFGIHEEYQILIYICVTVLGGCLIPTVFNKLVALTYYIVKRQKYKAEYWLTGRTLVSSILIVAIAKCFSGIAVTLLAISVVDSISFYNGAYIMAVNLISTAIGMIAIFAPAGLGVKESIQIVLLGAVLDKEVAVVLVAMASIQSVFGDIIFYIATRFLKK